MLARKHTSRRFILSDSNRFESQVRSRRMQGHDSFLRNCSLTVGTVNRRQKQNAIGVTIAISCFFGVASLGNQCPQQKLCRCKYYGEEIDLHCIATTDLVELKECLRENFHNSTIRALHVKECNAIYVPPKFIPNITLKRLHMKCPLSDISVDAFLYGNYLFEIHLTMNRLTVLADAFTTVAELRQLTIINGTLESIGEQFRDLRKLRILSLARNRIRYVSPNAFSSLTRLEVIYLSYNEIKHLDSKTFSACKNILVFKVANNFLMSAEGFFVSMNPTTISLENNDLTHIDIFRERMYRTKELYLSSNPVGRIDSGVFLWYLKNLVTLDLSNMSLTDISEKTFAAFPSLRTLDLSNNLLQSIHRKTFYTLPALEVLNLRKNNLSSIKGIFRRPHHLKMRKLDISSNNIVDLGDSLVGAQNLVAVKFSKNKVKSLNGDNFRRIPTLRIIIGGVNNISTLTSDCFLNLMHLEQIRLSLNSIVTLNGSISNLPRLTKLVLPLNHIEEFGDDDLINLPILYYVNLMGNKLTSIGKQFRNLNNLDYLNLENNRILVIPRDSFPRIIGLNALYLGGNDLSCDCRMEWLKVWSVGNKGRLKGRPQCQAPSFLKGKYFKRISQDDLIDWKESCPLQCECLCVSKGEDFGIAVDCTGKNLTEVPETFPSKMISLNLSHNNISVFPSIKSNGTLSHHLEKLNIEDNRVGAIEGLHFLKNLSILRLASNCLETIERTVNSNYSLVTLSGNPWLCDCSTLWFRSWLLTLKDEIPDINQTRCGRGSVKEELRSTPIIYLSEKDICPTKVALYVAISFGILVFLLLVSSSSFTYYRYRLNIKVWLYAHGFSFVKEEEIDKDKPFDAFVSFSSRDEKFVYGTLRRELENTSPEYFLCIHDRNFPAGNRIHDSIVSAVKNSKRTLLVLSKNYLESEWCSLEFRTAHLQALKDKINRVVIIIYGELPPENEIHEDIQVYLKSTTYMIWGERYFWQKLRYALPKVQANRERQEFHYDETTGLLLGY